MNLNNLAELKEEAKTLGMGKNAIEEMEESMKNGVPNFSVQETGAGDKKDMNVNFHFKQSSQSDYYYLNRFDVVQNVMKALEEGHKYMVIGEKDANGKHPVATFKNIDEAIANFNKRETSAELAVGKDAGHKTKLAGIEEGKVNYVAPEFKRAFYSPPLPQTFWVDHGKGFTAEQAVNLVQGRAVYRDDLLSNGVPYKAWVMLDTEKPRDRQNNLVTRQFHDPGYGFDLDRSLSGFKIKEMEVPEKAEQLTEAIRNGKSPFVTAVKNDGAEVKVRITAAVRYGKLNFYSIEGKPEKREQFEKASELGNNFDKKQQQAQGQEQGIGI